MREESREIELDAELGSISCSVLVLTGDSDDVAMTAEHRARYERGLADLCVVTLRGAGHGLSVDGRPDALHTELGGFVATIDTQRT